MSQSRIVNCIYLTKLFFRLYIYVCYKTVLPTLDVTKLYCRLYICHKILLPSIYVIKLYCHLNIRYTSVLSTARHIIVMIYLVVSNANIYNSWQLSTALANGTWQWWLGQHSERQLNLASLISLYKCEDIAPRYIAEAFYDSVPINDITRIKVMGWLWDASLNVGEINLLRKLNDYFYS